MQTTPDVVLYFFFFFNDQCFPQSAEYVGLYSQLKWLRWHLQQAPHFILQLSQFKHVILTADAQGTFWHSGILELKCYTRLSIRRMISMIWGSRKGESKMPTRPKGKNTQNKAALKLSYTLRSIDFVQIWNWARAKLHFSCLYNFQTVGCIYVKDHVFQTFILTQFSCWAIRKQSCGELTFKLLCFTCPQIPLLDDL